MDIADFLTANRILLGLRIRDKTSLLAELARLSESQLAEIPASAIERALVAREQLGSTGLGAGFALPHARIEHLSQFLGLFVRLGRAIDFNSIDGKPVDLVFLLLMPAEATDTVGALAAVSRRFRDTGLVAQLRKTTTQDAAFGLLTDH